MLATAGTCDAGTGRPAANMSSSSPAISVARSKPNIPAEPRSLCAARWASS